VADDDGEIAVALDPSLADRLYGAFPAVAVFVDDGRGGGRSVSPGLRDRRLPVVDRLHIALFSGVRLNTVGQDGSR